MALSLEIVESATAQYMRENDRFGKLATIVRDICQEAVREANIPATIQHRVKSVESFTRKLKRYRDDPESAKAQAIGSAMDAIDSVGDLAGVRIATYVEADRNRVVELIKRTFQRPGHPESVRVEVMDKDSGYRAVHCQVLLPQQLLHGSLHANLWSTSAEVQVCSMLSHIWNEIEHDMRYKPLERWGTQEAQRDALLQSLQRIALEGDNDIESLLGLRSEIAAEALVQELVPLFDVVSDFRSNCAQVLREIVRLGYSSTEQIVNAFASDEQFVQKGRENIGQYNSKLALLELSELYLDANNADVLLALVLERHAEDISALYSQAVKSGDALRIGKIAHALSDFKTL